MANVLFTPQQREVKEGRKSGSNFGALAGAVLGGLAGSAGGPAGVAAGASTGASLGGLFGGAIDPGEQAEVVQSSGPAPVQSSGAAQRRLEEIKAGPTFQLAEAREALKGMPLDQQQEFAPVLDKALEVAQQPRRIGIV